MAMTMMAASGGSEEEPLMMMVAQPQLSSSGGGGAIFAKITSILFDKDGLIKFKAKSGELPIDADAIDDSTSTKKLTTQAEKDDITDLKGALKTTTGSGGKGVFVNTNKTETESHVAVDSTTAKMQAGTRTLVDLSETSPGGSHEGQAGDGSGSSFSGGCIAGHSTFQNAM